MSAPDTMAEDFAHLGLDELRAATRKWATAERARFRSLAGETRDEAERLLLAQGAALDCAPLGLMSGAWLQWLSSMATADDQAALAALALYASDVGVGRPHDSRGAAFSQLLRVLKVGEHAQPAARLALDLRVADEAFELAALLLLMGRHPEEFHAEILGADLCLREAGLLPALELVDLSGAGIEVSDLNAGRPRIRSDAPGGLPAAEQALEARGNQSGPLSREAHGFRWAFTMLRTWSDGLLHRLAALLDPAHRAAEMLRARAREGSVYHRNYKLAGRSLADWLKEAVDAPLPLLDALATSPLIRPGKPERSPLINGLVGERGAMFRVFTPTDLEILANWIRSLPDTDKQGTSAAATDGEDLSMLGGAPVADAGTEKSGIPVAGSVKNRRQRDIRSVFPLSVDGDSTSAEHDVLPASLRDAYVRLQRRAQSPALSAYARTYVHGWLGRASHRLADVGVPLPEEWPAEGLRPWLANQHDRHAEEFESMAEAGLPSREQLIESTVQLAPLTMIDGGWLQGFTDYELASSDIGFSLFETYWDELGNGRAELNHPLIYRQLVESMGVELPPTGTIDFAHWTGFEDRSFELPVFWLSIGRFPKAFQPEILGLNLAMELSGVGGSYRRARLGLRAHGFSTRFVDIHNTIDNVATGHSAWAADAIDSYMAAIAPPSGTRARDELWTRVRTGYRALNPPSGWSARRAQRRAESASRPL
ncbi:iron-containing redox enzyme family protein [Streptomyces violascens]|uniref:iron-containing redox enzyme family protein n=1 Tax=Streptomyces violascens TaxID=67381 RepID=UPI003661E2BB